MLSEGHSLPLPKFCPTVVILNTDPALSVLNFQANQKLSFYLTLSGFNCYKPQTQFLFIFGPLKASTSGKPNLTNGCADF